MGGDGAVENGREVTALVGQVLGRACAILLRVMFCFVIVMAELG